MNIVRRRLAPLVAAGFALASHAAQLVASPSLATYGQPVKVELRDTRTFLPATRFTRVGSSIVIDYEHSPLAFPRPDFGPGEVSLGELVPGNYAIEARLFRMDEPQAPPQLFSRTLAVAPPERWGLYLIPREPEAFAPTDVMIRSAAYFDPGSMQASVAGNVIRVDFDYRGDASVGGPIPAGMTSFAAVRLPALAPGHYVAEGWGRDKTKAAPPERYFTQAFAVSSAAPVIEYYAESLDHYFITAAPGDIAMLDAGAMGGWKRTGQKFKAWLRPGDAPPNAKPVCRFYARVSNSHFYTGNADDCAYLKALESNERADAQARGQPFQGWAFESIAFYALVPENGQCAPGTSPVHRAYNNRAEQHDSNHRFTPDPRQHLAMTMTWLDEGVAFCSPP